MEKDFNILLTSAGRRSYLVEYFKEALEGRGLVHAANSEESTALFAADRSVITPLIYNKEYIPFLLDYCRENRISLVISLFDIDLPVLAAHRREFAEIGAALAVSDPETVAVCNDKWKTYCFLSEKGFPVPKTFLGLQEAKAAAKSGTISWPLMVKPRWGMGSLSIFQADNEEELDVFYRKAQEEIRDSYLCYESVQDVCSCVLIQEKLEGTEYGLDVINDLQGNYCNTIVKRKGAMRSGETDCAETVDSPVLQDLGKRLGSLLRHRGNLDTDVFESRGTYYILELNARFGGGYPFSHAAGVNLPGAIICWAMGGKAPEEWLRARAGVRAMKDIRILTL